jgi:hypothetical protein
MASNESLPVQQDFNYQHQSQTITSAPKSSSRNGQSKLIGEKITEVGLAIKPVMTKRRTTEAVHAVDNFTAEFDVRKLS